MREASSELPYHGDLVVGFPYKNKPQDKVNIHEVMHDQLWYRGTIDLEGHIQHCKIRIDTKHHQLPLFVRYHLGIEITEVLSEIPKERKRRFNV